MLAAASGLGACDAFTEEAEAPVESDAEAGDAAVLADGPGPADGPATADAGYCASQGDAAFCASFDGVNLVGEWSNQDVTGGATATAVPSDSSPPNAIHLSIPGSLEDTGNPLRRAILTKAIPGDMAKLSLAFDFKTAGLCALGSSSVTYVNLTAKGSEAGTLNAQFLSTKSGLKMFVKDGPTLYSDLSALPNITPWTRVTIDAANGELVIKYNGALASAAPIPFSLTSTLMEITFGLATSGQSNECDVTYDSIVARLAP